MNKIPFLIALTLIALSCSDDSVPSRADGGAGADAGDPSAALFDPSTLITVDITMAAADWEIIRQEKRDFSKNPVSCPTGPFVHTYTYKKAKVTVNGKVVKDAGVRKRGFIGSVNPTKPSLKVKFDHFVIGQTLYGLERLTLSNNVQDPSHMRQCLNYDLARRAGVAAPRCNFAVVKVNGKELGLFSNVESIKKRFLARNFKDNDGDLFEATVADFRDGFMKAFEPKTSSTDKTAARIKAVAAALKAPDDKLLSTLAPLVDVDSFATFWAVNSLSGNSDSYFTKGNNFFVYFDPGAGNKMSFIPWGADTGWGAYGGKAGSFDVQARPILARRLYLLPAGQKKYFGALSALLAGAWNETRLKGEIDRMERLIGAAAGRDPYMGKGGKGGDFASAVKLLRDYLGARRAAAKAVIAAPPTWTEALSTRRCGGTTKTTYLGSGTFASTYGGKGSGTIALTEGGKAVAIAKVTSAAGVDAKTSGRSVLDIAGEITSSGKTHNVTARFSVADAAFKDGATLKVAKGGTDLTGALIGQTSSGSKTWTMGTLTGGVLTLTKAGATKGAAVEGTFSGAWSTSGGKK